MFAAGPRAATLARRPAHRHDYGANLFVDGGVSAMDLS
jgi:hypothetical protein